MKLTIPEIAEVAHEVNRALCKAFGDDSQLPWLETTLENKDASITQVEFTLANPDATPEDQHNEWMRKKLANGWKFGPVKDTYAKTHPDLVLYSQLSDAKKSKDYAYGAVVRTLGDIT